MVAVFGKSMKAGLGVLTLAGVLTGAAQAADTDASKVAARVTDATQVIHELAKVPDDGIPDRIAKKARCVIVVPGFKKGAFIGGVQYGQGLATCFVAHKGWSAPAMIQMSGVSFGLQAGGQSTDLVLVGMSKQSGDNLLKAKVKLGGDIAAAAGPVGRDSKADTTVIANAGFLTYSRSKGLFAGIDLTGDEVNQNEKATAQLYGKEIPFQTILSGTTSTPASARPFIAAVTKMFGGAKTRPE